LILLTLHEVVGDSKNYANTLRPALPKLLELLKHPNSTYSTYVSLVLGRFVEDKEAITAVRPLLADPSWEVRGYAALALAGMDDLTSCDAIVNKLKESLNAKIEQDVVRNLFKALVRLDPVRARVVLDNIQDATTREELQKLLPKEKS
jgi:HEAT repeat protein